MTKTTNRALSVQILRQLAEAGVSEVCVCPGARNAPLVALLGDEASGLRCYQFFEERSAAFFALGRIKATDRPVAVITTSGTAAGELLPATMEAHYAGLPLVLLTADRPRRFRWTGAPQTAEQVGLFGVYVEQSLDLAGSETFELWKWSRRRPLHINACFEEPLLEPGSAGLDLLIQPELTGAENCASCHAVPQPAGMDDAGIEAAHARLLDFLATVRQPLVLVGALRSEDQEPVIGFLEALGAPVYLEATSGLREEPRLRGLRIHAADGILERARAAGYELDGVLRIGGVPTLRLWRDLENLGGKIPVCSVSREPFAGLSWASLIGVPPAKLLGPEGWSGPLRMSEDKAGAAFLERERALGGQLSELLSQEPRSEAGMVRALSERMAEGASVYLGNSLPIREWDLAASARARGFRIGASRGLNGIDGQLSTFLGFSEPGRESWGLLGDLTALYDLAAPWVAPQLEGLRARLAIINNGGGKIFARMFPQERFQNPHAIEFGPWAALWGLAYERLDEIPATLGETPAGLQVLELRPDAEATARFWRSYESLCLGL